MLDRAAVIASDGETYWQDHTNDVVWIKVTSGDLVQFGLPSGPPPQEDEVELSDFVLYNEFHLRIW